MRAGAAALSVAALLLAGCASPPPPPPPAQAPPRDDLYVLLPSADGKTGAALAVTHAGSEQVLATPYAAARIKQEGRIESGTATPAEVGQVFGDALAALPPRPVSYLLYFVEGKDELTPESRQVVQQIFAEIARRPSPEIVVIGHTDRVGSVAFNDKLSLQRANRMRDELIKLGIPADRIEVAGRGEREPLVPTDDEVPEPRNRRVEISVR
ncbi:MAG TPA: OmpA family protein [Candidatus Methylomirabilis sp.]|nr:OmpA family protein [Candidatus Methylomirabilis sp.]